MLSRLVVLALCVIGLTTRVQAQERPQFRLFAIRENNKWGFIDRIGKVVVKPSFDEVGSHSEGTWAVRSGAKWGFVAESTGGLSVPPRYEAVAAFSEGLCAVVAGGKVGFIGKNGVFQIPPRYLVEKFDITFGIWLTTYRFSGGLCPAQISESQAKKNRFPSTWGFIDRRGQWKISPRFRDAEAMSDGMAAVTLEKGDGSIDGYVSTEGKFVPLPEGASSIYSEPFYEGLAAIAMAGTAQPRLRYGFIDKTGKWVIEPRFSMILPGSDPIEDRVGFQGGLATVLVGTTPADARLGWVRKDGTWAIEPRFNGGGIGFMRGVTPARLGDKPGEGLGGYIDRTGQFVITPQFEKMGVFTDVLAPVQKKGEKWGYIDASGAMTIPPRFDYIPVEQVITPEMMALHFRDGLAYVAQGKTRGYIDTAGKWVWKEATAKKSDKRLVK